MSFKIAQTSILTSDGCRSIACLRSSTTSFPSTPDDLNPLVQLVRIPKVGNKLQLISKFIRKLFKANLPLAKPSCLHGNENVNPEMKC